jgi:predicted HicB family RNase H-like nuclease
MGKYFIKFTLRLTPKEKKIIAKKARAKKISMAEYLRWKVVK